jgi:hypothetical protein
LSAIGAPLTANVVLPLANARLATWLRSPRHGDSRRPAQVQPAVLLERSLQPLVEAHAGGGDRGAGVVHLALQRRCTTALVDALEVHFHARHLQVRLQPGLRATEAVAGFDEGLAGAGVVARAQAVTETCEGDITRALHLVLAPRHTTTQAEAAPVVAGIGTEVRVVDLRLGAAVLLLDVGAAGAGQHADLPAGELAVDTDQQAVAVGFGAGGVAVAVQPAVAADGLHPCTGGVTRVAPGAAAPARRDSAASRT